MLRDLLKISKKEMEAILGLLPIFMYFVVQNIYNFGSPSFNDIVPSYIHTNWNIMYFSGTYLCWILHILLKLKSVSKIYKLMYCVFGIALLNSTIIELSKWGSEFGDYLIAVNALEKGVFLIGIILIGLLIVLFFKKS